MKKIVQVAHRRQRQWEGVKERLGFGKHPNTNLFVNQSQAPAPLPAFKARNLSASPSLGSLCVILCV